MEMVVNKRSHSGGCAVPAQPVVDGSLCVRQTSFSRFTEWCAGSCRRDSRCIQATSFAFFDDDKQCQ